MSFRSDSKGMATVLMAGLVFGAQAFAAELLPPDRPIGEVIDHYLDAKLRSEKVTPAGSASNTALVRRLYLDLVGRIPTAAEARQHASSPIDQKSLVQTLLKSPGFARHQADEFDTFLRNNNPAAPSLHAYLLKAFEENRPWDAMFRDLIGAAPEREATKPEAFVLKRLKDADFLTRDVSSVFFGLNIACAQCHRHPEIEDLTQDFYYGMKGFFAASYDFHDNLLERRFVKPSTYTTKLGKIRPAPLMFLSGATVDVETIPEMELMKGIEAETKLIQEKTKLYGKTKELPPTPDVPVRRRLADVALDSANRDLFARAIVNRLFYRFYGRGLVMRVDQMHAKNEASHPELLQWLARDLMEHQYDLKRLIGGLVSSQAYARSSEWKGEPPPRELFAVAAIRPLTPPQWILSFRVASDPSLFPLSEDAQAHRQALANVFSASARGKLFAFLEEPGDDFQIGVDEPLKLSNHEAVLQATGDKLLPILRKSSDRRAQVEDAVWAVLSRPPTSAESALLVEFLEQYATQPDNGLRLMVWSLVNSPEFRFNH